MQNSSSISSFRNRMIARILSIMVLAAVCFVSWSGYCRLVCSPKNALYQFYNIDSQTIDVLCVGSSHVYCGINPVQLYRDYGIAAYDLAAGSQSIWHSYYYINEALKTQMPDIVILDVYTMRNKKDKHFDSKLQANLLTMNPSINKWNALMDSGGEDKLEIFMQFPITHDRYKDLERSDFSFGDGYYLGYSYHPKIVQYKNEEIVDIREVDGKSRSSEKAEEYLRKCIELCQRKGIRIILTNTPWPDIKEEDQEIYNYIQGIADEYGIPFLNGCLRNHEFDWSSDSMGDGGHLNHSGVTKWTKMIGEWLCDHYELPDRRGNPRYRAWDDSAERLDSRIRKQELADADHIEDVMRILREAGNLCCVVETRGNYLLDGKDLPKVTIGQYELDLRKEKVYVIRNGFIFEERDGADDYDICIWQKPYTLQVSNISGEKAIILNGQTYGMVKNGVNLLVYDESLCEIVGKIGIDADNGYEMVKWKST